MRLLALIFSLLLYGCGSSQSYEEELFERADYVFRCETTVVDTPTNRIVKYKPIETLKGQIEDNMISDDGFLNYTETTSPDVTFDHPYIFYLEKKGIPTKDPTWGFNCELHVIIDTGK